MLVEFRAQNYRSICEEQIISLIPLSNQGEYIENIITDGKYNALNSLAFYGANSSGKSNLLQSMGILDRLLYTSSKSGSTDELPYDPFLLKEGYSEKPTRLEIIFVIDSIRYRYGIEFNRFAVISEWLFRKKTGREVDLFSRSNEIIEVSSAFIGKKLVIDAAIEATRDNALFLSFCDVFNVEEAKTIFKWFDTFLHVDGLNTSRDEFNTINLFKNENYTQKIKDYLLLQKLGFEDVLLLEKEFDPTEIPDIINDSHRNEIIEKLSGKKGFQPSTVHPIYDKDGNKTDKRINWPLHLRESAGTNKIFQFSGPVLYTLFNGGVLVVDEIEAKIHPELTLNTIKLFLNKKTNPKNAQIIFATHDTNLLNYANLRRDQINFVEKNKHESTETYSLSDIKYFDGQKERIETNKEKRYLEGRYGAIPFLGSFSKKIMEWYG